MTRARDGWTGVSLSENLSLHVPQERSDKAQMIVNVVRKKRSQLVRGMERLSDAYITLAYMDASRHKTEKSERSRASC